MAEVGEEKGKEHGNEEGKPGGGGRGRLAPKRLKSQMSRPVRSNSREKKISTRRTSLDGNNCAYVNMLVYSVLNFHMKTC